MAWSHYGPAEAAALALVLVALVRFAPRSGQGAPIDITPTALGYLAGGTPRAVITALAVLYRRGAVRVARRGIIERTEADLAGLDSFTRAVHTALDPPNGPNGIVERPEVDNAARALRRELVAAQLWLPAGRRVITWLLLSAMAPLLGAQLAMSHDATSIALAVLLVVLAGPVFMAGQRTRAARRLLKTLPRDHPDDAGYAVAAYGKTALLTIMPDFARDGGLLDGGIATQFVRSTEDSQD